MSSGITKRRIKEIPDSDPKDKEIAKIGMEIDTDMTCEVKTTVSVSFSLFFCVYVLTLS